MAITAYTYGLVYTSAFSGEINVSTGTFKVLLTTSAYTPNQDTHRYKSSVTNEVTGTNYTAGGATLAGVAIAYNTGTNVFNLDANDVVWANSTITARRAVVYRDSGTAATSPLIMWVDFGQDIVSTNSNFSITWDVGGLINVVVA